MDSKVRSGQLLTPFGIGALLAFPEEISVMVAGLDLWENSIEERKIQAGIDAIDDRTLRINEDRLQKLLGVNYFNVPFPYTEKNKKNNYLTIPAVRFPRWHHCTNQRCGHMEKIKLSTFDSFISCPKCDSKMIPVRFVAVCEHGHIQDVPFLDWVHDGHLSSCEKPELKYSASSGSGDLGSINISCTRCKRSKTLAGIMNVYKDDESNIIYDSPLARIGLDKEFHTQFSKENPNSKSNNPLGVFCSGEKPWLGEKGIIESDNCNSHLRVLIKGGSNIHYSDIQSAIYLPKTKPNINPYAQKVIDNQPLGLTWFEDLFNQQSDGLILKAVLQNEQVVKDMLIDIDLLYNEIVEQFSFGKKNTEINTELDIRWEEYKAIIEGRDSESADLKAVPMNLDEYSDSEFLAQYFDTIVLLEKLKETRVFTGFSRITPRRGNLEDRMKLLSNKTVDWLPAIQVSGEGIFLKFNQETLEKWEKRNGHHFEGLISRYHDSMIKRKPEYEKRDISPKFILIHTFSHLLIKRLCFNCGYGSSSIRERIYFSTIHDKQMEGLLIYTSSGDSEGSLGGLVRQGKQEYLAKLIKDTVADADWCSADPVCSEIGTKYGQGPDNVNGSACHNCCLVPETSCEEFNTLLDRTAIVGSLENKDLGFF